MSELKTYILHIKDNKITIQKREYIEDGWYIEIIGKEITIYEIPLGGGEPIKIGNFYGNLIDSINYAELYLT